METKAQIKEAIDTICKERNIDIIEAITAMQGAIASQDVVDEEKLEILCDIKADAIEEKEYEERYWRERYAEQDRY